VNNHNTNASSNHENPISYLSRAFNQPIPIINLKCVSSKEIEDITKSLKIKNSHGYGGISTKNLKVSIHYISSPLTYICNRMLSSGIFPTRLTLKSNLYLKEEIKMIPLIIDLFLCSHHFQRFLKRLSIIDYIITLIIFIFSLMNNLVSGMNHPQTLHPIS